jgi:TolB-like protein
MKARMVTMLTLLAVVLASPAAAVDKVAVLDFKTVAMEADIGVAAAEILRTEMVQTGAFTVVERDQLAALLNEQKLGAAGLVEPAEAARIGKLAGADKVAQGSAVRLGEVITVNVRLIDVETGVVSAAELVQAKGLDTLPELLRQTARKLAGLATETDPFFLSFEEGEDTGVGWRGNTPAEGLVIERVAKHATHGQHALMVRVPAVDFPGVTFTQLPGNWSRYRKLSMDIYLEDNTNPHAILAMRIDDPGTHDYDTSFNWETQIQQGHNQISVRVDSVADAIDIGKVRALHVYLQEVDRVTSYYIDNLRIE